MRRMKKIFSVFAAVTVVVSTISTGPAITPVQVNAATTQIDTTTWNYLDDNTTPSQGWNSDSEFNVNDWKSGTASFGAKNGTITDLGGGCIPDTLLNQYIEGTEKDIPVFYFRQTFDIENAAEVDRITSSVLYDDAAIIYINGKQIGAFDADNFNESGYGGSNASAPKTGEIDFTDMESLNLKETGNVLAVEIHQGRESSSDVYFDMDSIVADYDYSVTYEINNISLDIGADETEKNLVWYTNVKDDTYVSVAVKPEGWVNGNDFPTEAETFSAVSENSSIDGYTSNKASITELKENTEYLYQISAGTLKSDIYSFSTGEFGDKEDFNFLLAGDPQIGASGNSESDEEGWTDTLNRAVTAFPDSSFLISVGDQINDKGSKEETQYTSFLEPAVLKSVPLAANVGNHDSGSSKYSQHFAIPNVSTKGVSNGTGTQSGDYYFMYNGVLIMSINSNNTSTAEHKAFLQETLEKEGENARWKIVTFHHSIYSVANHATDGDIIVRRNELAPIFTELDIDVVLMGHDHYYTRSYMMDGTTPIVPEGNDISQGEEAPSSVIDPQDGQVLYITANSASGSKYYAYNNSNSITDYVAVQDQSNRETISNVEITDTSFTITTYYADQEQLQEMDTFTIVHTPKDEEAPVITLPAENKNEIYVGDAFNPMEGVIASDNIDGDLTDNIVITGNVNVDAAGTYTIEYKVTDKAGNETKIERIITVIKDRVKPTISFAGDNEVKYGETFDAFKGVTATDDIDGDITIFVTLVGMVDTKVSGQYYLTYQVTDKAGNTCSVTRTITVKEQEKNTTEETTTAKVTEKKTEEANKSNNIPKKTRIKKVTSSKKILIIKLSKIKKATSYQVKYSTNRKFKKAKKITTKKTTYSLKKFRKAEKGTVVFFKARAVRTVKSKKYYSAWSKVKRVKVK